jgi:DNA repair protein radc
MDKMRELLSNCLREDVNGYVVSALMNEFPTIQDLMNANEDELKLIRGIGAVRARQLTAILEFVKKVNAPTPDKRVIIHSPRDIYDLMRSSMEYLQTEHFCVVGLSTKNHVIFQETVSTGTLNASLVHPREVFKRLIKRACASALLVHNHPSFDPTPSQEDIELTQKLIEAGKLLDIQVLDHVIIGHGQYISFKEKGLI